MINNRKEHHHFEKSIDLQIYTRGSQSQTGPIPKLWFLCRVTRLYSIGSLNGTQEKSQRCTNYSKES
ncbi:hypothetical protein NC652_036151 [Populus alba x Populus x berolinensis]|nr:hypothetical protein NC652_036146 [Populus alba x Populus x berolinensis]KAJ6870418.1 hypothetical protein NC652_036151 [Populus alba x Populus x berolinensis]